jgi:hypothetical protein
MATMGVVYACNAGYLQKGSKVILKDGSLCGIERIVVVNPLLSRRGVLKSLTPFEHCRSRRAGLRSASQLCNYGSDIVCAVSERDIQESVSQKQPTVVSSLLVSF